MQVELNRLAFLVCTYYNVGIKYKGDRLMKSVPIKLSFAEEVKSFVNIVNRYPYDMDLRAGRHVVDAKSILGIFSLDLSKPIVLEVYNDSCAELVNDLAPFIGE